jgi:hypothetical protein
MPSDFNQPTLASTYADFLSYLALRDVDAITLCLANPSNKPTGTIKYDRAGDKFQEWDGVNFIDQLIAVAGGGTGSSTAAGARTNLGLGDMATQTSSAVSITGGTIAGNGSGLTTLNASNLSSGTVATARLGSGTANSGSYLRGDQTWAALVTTLPYGSDQTNNFTASLETIYNLNASSKTVTLPTVVGNAGKRIGLVNKSANGWTVTPAGGELILGAASWTFDFGIYSSALLIADANNGKWDVF